ncbi:hypothetical protein M0802_005569 [Mischocyttarus mexicanus]|nr:hypothetical protein M0802_005569 [Mischocyttarus mexicanus]
MVVVMVVDGSSSSRCNSDSSVRVYTNVYLERKWILQADFRVHTPTLSEEKKPHGKALSKPFDTFYSRQMLYGICKDLLYLVSDISIGRASPTNNVSRKYAITRQDVRSSTVNGLSRLGTP